MSTYLVLCVKDNTMDKQNIDPKPNDNHKLPKTGNLNKTGLDEWNARLDNNLEPEAEADHLADENAEAYQRSVENDTLEEKGAD
ncbi:MAG: hypothetical protein V4687_09380 [Bacteroidota bacterium]